MKKRILSALLALVMVLALLPATAFAVEYTTAEALPSAIDNPSKPGEKFYNVDSNGRVTTVTVQRAAQSDPTTGRVQGKWYWLDNKTNKDTYTYYEATTGLVAGTSGSGLWYPDVDAYTRTTTTSDGSTTKKVNGAFTLLDNSALSSLATYNDSSLTICMNGVSTATLTVPDVITQLRITNGGTGWFPAGTSQGRVDAITIDRSAYDATTKSGLTITADDISFGKITTNGRANTLNLTNCTVASIDMDGTTNGRDAAAPKTYSAQRVTMTGGSLGGDVTLTGDGSQVSLTSVSGDTFDINVISNGGSITVSGNSNVEDITSTARTKTGNYPSVKVTGGTVGVITRNNANGSDNGINIEVSGGGTTAGNISAALGRNTIRVSSATVGTITTSAGTLTIDGSYTKTGLVTLNDTTDTSGMTLSVGSGSTYLDIGGITSTSSKLRINSWPTNRDNSFGELNLGNYGGHGVKGGTFAGADSYDDEQCLGWFDTGLQYRVRTSEAAPWKLYGASELGQAISDLGTTVANQANKIVILGQPGQKYIDVMNGSTHWGRVYFATDSSIILPSEINSVKINSWIGPNGETKAPGERQAILKPAGDSVTINATDVAQDVTKIMNVSVDTSTTVENKDIRVSFKEGTTSISLSGAIKTGSGGLAVIRLNLTTDVIGTDGSPVVLRGVPVVYDTNNGNSLKFDNWTNVGGNSYGAKVLSNGTLQLANGTIYTVSNGGLKASAPDLGLWKGDAGVSPIVVTFGGTLSNWRPEQKDDLAAQLSGEDCGFIIGNNRAMAEAINAAQATITGTTSSLVDRAQSYVWTNGNQYLNNNGQPNGLGKGKKAYGTGDDAYLTKHSGSISKPGSAFAGDAADIQLAYSKAYIVPYLVINVTDYNQNGTLTATMTPYYRVDVSAALGYDADEYYTVQTGRALTALTGEMISNTVDPLKVTFKLTSTAFTENSYMHQDGQYVYKPAADTGKLTWSISHAGANGTLGTMKIDGNVGPISMTSDIDGRDPDMSRLACTYDTLQAAVDDTVPGLMSGGAVSTCDTIIVGSSYKGSCAVNMTGLARTIKVQFLGNHDVVTGQGSTDVKSSDGYNYTIQLTKDTATGGNVAISVQTATNGAATANTTRAKAGQTVTITATPNAGYSTLGMTAVGNNNVNIAVTGSGNSWSFKVPENVTSVTVTPRFGIAGQATVSVNNNTNGTATVAGNASTVAQGSTVTVYTSPRAGYRATSVSVRFSNGSTVNATSAGTNTWTFTVPANATTVTVTPNFSVDTGLPFLDVAPTEYYLPYVRFVYNNGMMKGDGNDYTFNGNGNITRAQIVLILYRLSGSPTVSTITSFTDVPTNEWYSSAVAWAASNKIVEGRSTTKFDPGTAITRQELAAILYRYNNFRGLSGANLSNLSQFTDRGYVSNYALTPMQWAVGNGIITGTTTNTLSPNGTATRYQAATMLTRYCQTFLKMV